MQTFDEVYCSFEENSTFIIILFIDFCPFGRTHYINDCLSDASSKQSVNTSGIGID